MQIGSISLVQVAFVVRDLEAGVARHDEAWGPGEWVVYELGGGSFEERVYRDRPGDFALRHALSWRESAAGARTQFEVCQPLSGSSVWQDQLDAGRDGIHHFGAFVDDLDFATKEIEAFGWRPIQMGRGFGAEGDGEFRYFEHPSTPVLAELVSAPKVRRPPLKTIKTG